VAGLISMNVTVQDVTATFRAHAGIRIDVDDLFLKATHVIVFGSRALGVHSLESDLDVLCVAQRRLKIKTPMLDFICVPIDEWTNSYWRGCELGSHIAKYGIWIAGRDDWRRDVQVSDETVVRKERRVLSLIQTVDRVWGRLQPVFQTKYRVTVRRELQRLGLLQGREAVPPTPILDSLWKRGQQSSESIVEIAGAAYGLRWSQFVRVLLNSDS
jgi:Nucleotidyltransferase domain